MIFDIFDPLRPGKIYKIPLFVIAITFMTDFFHMTNNLKAQTNQNSKPLINILKKSTDAIIAAMFCLSYFFYAKIIGPEGKLISPIGNKCIVSIIFLTLSYLSVDLYEICFLIGFSNCRTRKDYLLPCPFLICMVGVFLSWLCYYEVAEKWKLYITWSVVILSSILYCVYVFLVWKQTHERKHNNRQNIDPNMLLSKSEICGSGDLTPFIVPL